MKPFHLISEKFARFNIFVGFTLRMGVRFTFNITAWFIEADKFYRGMNFHSKNQSYLQ